MRIHISFQDDDTPMVKWNVDAVPRIGEKVASRPSDDSGKHFYLDFVVDVRHYEGEIHVLTSERR